jgi:hypothetical protein
MKQPHTEETITHTAGEQDTGNHKVPDAPDAKGADRFGGSRAGSENVESSSQVESDSSSSANDVASSSDKSTE